MTDRKASADPGAAAAGRQDIRATAGPIRNRPATHPPSNGPAAAHSFIDRLGAPAVDALPQETRTLPNFHDYEVDDPEFLSGDAAQIFRMRRARDRHMPAGLMGEPAWDILLALYSEEPAKLPVSTVCYSAGVPATTAMRWIAVLEEGRLVERTKHPRDRRIIFISLTPEGRLTVERCLKAMLRAARG